LGVLSELVNPPSAGARHPINPDTGLVMPGDYRRTLHAGCVGVVEDVAMSSRTVSGYETVHQLVVPYLGVFIYSAGGRSWLLDPNRVLFVKPGREFRDSHPLPDRGHAGIIVNISDTLLDELLAGRPERKSAFAEGARPGSPALLLLVHRLLNDPLREANALRQDELTIDLMQESFSAPGGLPGPRSSAVDRAKQLLHARPCEPLSLAEVAAEAGVTAIYLTSEFKRSEGVPLYRYQMQLRMAQALLQLPHTQSITQLALDLGFSSHSHFTAVFRSHFGFTPSSYRARHEPLHTRKRRASRILGIHPDQRAPHRRGLPSAPISGLKLG
jgi:AraC-like DNA-binding protein